MSKLWRKAGPLRELPEQGIDASLVRGPIVDVTNAFQESILVQAGQTSDSASYHISCAIPKGFTTRE